jgi:hypothetical protein
MKPPARVPRPDEEPVEYIAYPGAKPTWPPKPPPDMGIEAEAEVEIEVSAAVVGGASFLAGTVFGVLLCVAWAWSSRS